MGTRINGKFRRITLKPAFPHLELAEARSRARKIIADAQGGIGPEVRKKREEKGTFGAVTEAFMQDHAKHLRTRADMQRRINVDLAGWHDRPITSITRADIKERLREKARSAPISANRLGALISKIFGWALSEEIIQSSPAVRLPRYGKETERERHLLPDEIRLAWDAFGQLGYPFGPFLKMLLVTGQRRGEVASMKWNEIGPDGWRIPAERAKSSKGMLVPLSTLAREILDSVPRIGEHVFTVRGTGHIKGWGGAKIRADRLLHIPEWHHDLRRTMATQMRTLGIDRLVVSKLLNHAEAGVTKTYDRYSADPEKSAAMERWANRLREIVSGEPVNNVVQLQKSS